MTAPLLRAQNLVKEFRTGGAFTRGAGTVHALSDVSFEIEPGETLAVVGESGCGKSTLARCVTALTDLTAGTLAVDGENAHDLLRAEPLRFRRMIQIVFQDPYSSLNPRMRVGAIVEEPLIIHSIGTRDERKTRVAELFGLVGLDPAHISRFPHEFSGGQRQRIGLARALALHPSLIIADEPVSALDVSVQAQVVNLLQDLQAKLGLTYLFIAHDLRLVRQVCDRVAVMYRGRIVELAAAERLFNAPAHSYTQALMSAVPRVDPSDRTVRIPFAHEKYQPMALREVAPGHLAAV